MQLITTNRIVSNNKQSGQDFERIVRLGLVQATVSNDANKNLSKTVTRVEEAAKKGAQIVCLQELFRTRYFPQDEKKEVSLLAESIPGESTNAFSTIAKNHEVVIIVPLFEKGHDGKYYNTAVTIDVDGEIKGFYRKIHLPYDPLFYEKNYFEPGNKGFPVIKTHYANISTLICYDQWFPEPARICTLKGAEIIFYPTAIGWIKGYTSEDGDWHDAWKTVQRGHAIANGVHVAAVNRVGQEGELDFWGGSFVCDSFGKVIKEAGNQEEVLVVDVDLSLNKQIQDGWGFLKNRRPETYKALVEDFR